MVLIYPSLPRNPSWIEVTNQNDSLRKCLNAVTVNLSQSEWSIKEGPTLRHQESLPLYLAPIPFPDIKVSAIWHEYPWTIGTTLQIHRPLVGAILIVTPSRIFFWYLYIYICPYGKPSSGERHSQPNVSDRWGDCSQVEIVFLYLLNQSYHKGRGFSVWFLGPWNHFSPTGVTTYKYILIL